MAQPWYLESTQGRWFNEWTSTHVLWGAALYHYTGSVWTSMLWHTVYEMIEGRIFPVQARDTSLRNHIGDSLAALAGAGARRAYRR